VSTQEVACLSVDRLNIPYFRAARVPVIITVHENAITDPDDARNLSL